MKKLLKEVAEAFRAFVCGPAEAITDRQISLVCRTMLGVFVIVNLPVLLVLPEIFEKAAKTTPVEWLVMGLVAYAAFVVGGLAFMLRDLYRYIREVRSQIGGGGGSITHGSVG